MYPVPLVTPEIRSEAQNMDLVKAIQFIKSKDPLALTNIDSADEYRVKRILEVLLSGDTWTNISQTTTGGFLKEHPHLSVLGFWLDWPRPELYTRINKRVPELISGMLTESKFVIKEYGMDCPGLKSLGYNFALDFLNGNIDTNAFIERLAQSHRNYAKRQVTWFRKDPILRSISWNEAFDELKKIVSINQRRVSSEH